MKYQHRITSFTIDPKGELAHSITMYNSISTQSINQSLLLVNGLFVVVVLVQEIIYFIYT